jgi:hypothetical protein
MGVRGRVLVMRMHGAIGVTMERRVLGMIGIATALLTHGSVSFLASSWAE